MKELNVKQEKYITLFLSVVLPLSMIYILYVAYEFYPQGKSVFLYGDLNDQYLPFLSEFRNKLLNGDSLFYSWNLGLGSNFWALLAYYLCTPVNLFTVFVKQENLIEFVGVVVAIKSVLSSLTCTIYICYHNNKYKSVFACFGLFYALGSYMLMTLNNIIWLDAFIFFPLLMLFYERMKNTGKWKMYVVCLAYIMVSNYYMALLICVWLFVCALLDVCFYKSGIKQKLYALFLFGVRSVLSAMIAAVVLVPAYL